MSSIRLFSAAAVLALGLGAAQTAAAQASASVQTNVTAGAQAPAAAAPAAVSFKPVAVQGDLMTSLRLNGSFTTFVKALDTTNLAGLVRDNKNLTVFAPTDAAFAAMPADQLAALMANKTALQKFLLHHIVNAPIPSTKIKGVKGPVPTGAGDQMLLDGADDAGDLKVDGGKIVQPDVQTASGLLQVVDHVLVAGQGDVAPPAEAAPTAAGPAAPGAKSPS